MESKWCIPVLLLACQCTVIFCVSDFQKECSSGSVCFPSGRVPDDVTPSDHHYYCCLDRNMTRHSNKLDDGTVNCTCVPDLELDNKIQQWADYTMDKGRMCNREKDCAGSKSNITINDKFVYCCRQEWYNNTHISSDSTTFDGDKDEFIGCRCTNHPVPSPDPEMYAVPQTKVYNSSGEDCLYDKGCDDRPSLKCASQKATFCCYGSRGIVTVNKGNDVTSCTCTNEIFGKRCEPWPVSIAETVLPCLAECSNRTDDDVCTDDASNVFCCPTGMVVTASQNNGTFSSCTCKVGTQKTCGETEASAAFHQVLSQSVFLFAIVFALSFGHLDIFG